MVVQLCPLCGNTTGGGEKLRAIPLRSCVSGCSFMHEFHVALQYYSAVADRCCCCWCCCVVKSGVYEHGLSPLFRKYGSAAADTHYSITVTATSGKQTDGEGTRTALLSPQNVSCGDTDRHRSLRHDLAYQVSYIVLL